MAGIELFDFSTMGNIEVFPQARMEKDGSPYFSINDSEIRRRYDANYFDNPASDLRKRYASYIRDYHGFSKALYSSTKLCHQFALCIMFGYDSYPEWISSLWFPSSFDCSTLFTQVNDPREGDLIVYYNGRPVHFGVIGKGGYVISKWGKGKVYSHHPFFIPKDYGDKAVVWRAKGNSLREFRRREDIRERDKIFEGLNSDEKERIFKLACTIRLSSCTHQQFLDLLEFLKKVPENDRDNYTQTINLYAQNFEQGELVEALSVLNANSLQKISIILSALPILLKTLRAQIANYCLVHGTNTTVTRVNRIFNAQFICELTRSIDKHPASCLNPVLEAIPILVRFPISNIGMIDELIGVLVFVCIEFVDFNGFVEILKSILVRESTLEVFDIKKDIEKVISSGEKEKFLLYIKSNPHLLDLNLSYIFYQWDCYRAGINASKI